jgi:hypothetical protein
VAVTGFTLYFDGKIVGQAVGTATPTESEIKIGDGIVLLGPSPPPHTYEVTATITGAQGRRLLRALRPTRHAKKVWARLRKLLRKLLVSIAGEAGSGPDSKRARAGAKIFKGIRVPRSLR